VNRSSEPLDLPKYPPPLPACLCFRRPPTLPPLAPPPCHLLAAVCLDLRQWCDLGRGAGVCVGQDVRRLLAGDERARRVAGHLRSGESLRNVPGRCDRQGNRQTAVAPVRRAIRRKAAAGAPCSGRDRVCAVGYGMACGPRRFRPLALRVGAGAATTRLARLAPPCPCAPWRARFLLFAPANHPRTPQARRRGSFLCPS
jgi:hypothetical protein